MTAFLLWFMEITPFLRRLTSALSLPGDQMLNTSPPDLNVSGIFAVSSLQISWFRSKISMLFLKSYY